jgi:hypothetical protein
MLDFQERIAGCTIFSKVDLHKGYHQILMHPGDIPKTPIATPFRLFEILRCGPAAAATPDSSMETSRIFLQEA